MHRQKCLDSEYVGEGNWGWTPERTSSASQILKGPLSVPHPKPKSFYRDAYGWGVWDIQEELDSLYHIKVSLYVYIINYVLVQWLRFSTLLSVDGVQFPAKAVVFS